MPPKRRLASLSPGPSSPAPSPKSDAADDEPSPKKRKISSDKDEKVWNNNNDDKKDDKKDDKQDLATKTDGGSLGSDNRPMCQFGDGCYRKNPDHWKQCKHPPKREAEIQAALAAMSSSSPTSSPKPASSVSPSSPAPAATSSSTASSSSPAPSSPAPAPASPATKKDNEANAENVEAYKKVLSVILVSHKITVDEKRMLRSFRNGHGVTDDQHANLLGLFGWSKDEFEDGERKIEVELEEEKILLASNKAGVIWIYKDDKKKGKEKEQVFTKVVAQFFQTMSKAQANYSVDEVGVVVCPPARSAFEKQKSSLAQAKVDNTEEWGFHGTSKNSVTGIAETGFLHPDKINSSNKGKSTANKVTTLDSGFFGKGIYFSLWSDYAMYYSETRGSNQMLLCKILRGRCYNCKGRMDGKPQQTGYDSHFSPGGNEIIIFNPEHILPCYIITFSQQKAKTRAQEY